MGNGRKGMKGGCGAKRREAWGVMRRGQLLPEAYALKSGATLSAGPGDKIVKVGLHVIRIVDTVMSPNDPETRK